LDLLLIFGADEIDETKLAELGAGYLIDQLKNPNSPYTKKIISEISKRYGQEVADQFTKEALGELVSLPMAFYKGFQWAWNNIKADKEHSFNVIVVDPPEEYTVTGEPIEDILYIGSQSDITSNSGEGNIQISLNKEGLGEYIGLFEIDTKDTTLSEEDFAGLSKIIINEKGKKTNNELQGEVFIEVYFTDEVTSNAYDLLLSDVGLSESLIKSYFNKLEYYNSKIENDHILLYGRGDLLESSFHNEINNTINITKEKIIGEYHYLGEYLELFDDTYTFNLTLGSFLNIPLKNTLTELNIPMNVETISPNTDKINGKYIWYETPSKIVINGKIDSGTPGFEFLLVILSILSILIIMLNRKIIA
jgi:hypothetical protein